MNFGFGQKQAPPQQPAGPDPVVMAKIQMSSYTDMFNKMSKLCFKKCMSNMKDTELNVGEMSCVDRCVGKYIEAQEKVGMRLSEMEQAMRNQQ